MDSLPKDKWAEFCDRVSKQLVGLRAEVEVQSLDIGDQIEAEYVPFLGLVYDHKDDLIEVALEGLDHLIRKPKELFTKGDKDGLDAVLVVDAEGTRHLITLKEPLMLPAPGRG